MTRCPTCVRANLAPFPKPLKKKNHRRHGHNGRNRHDITRPHRKVKASSMLESSSKLFFRSPLSFSLSHAQPASTVCYECLFRCYHCYLPSFAFHSFNPNVLTLFPIYFFLLAIRHIIPNFLFTDFSFLLSSKLDIDSVSFLIIVIREELCTLHHLRLSSHFSFSFLTWCSHSLVLVHTFSVFHRMYSHYVTPFVSKVRQLRNMLPSVSTYLWMSWTFTTCSVFTPHCVGIFLRSILCNSSSFLSSFCHWATLESFLSSFLTGGKIIPNHNFTQNNEFRKEQ